MHTVIPAHLAIKMDCLQEVLEAAQKAMGSLHKRQVKRTKKALHLSLTRGWILTLSVDQKLNPAAFMRLHLQSRPWPWPWPQPWPVHDPLTMTMTSDHEAVPPAHMAKLLDHDPRMIHYPCLIHDPWMTPETWLVHNPGIMRDRTDTWPKNDTRSLLEVLIHDPLIIVYVRCYIAPA